MFDNLDSDLIEDPFLTENSEYRENHESIFEFIKKLNPRIVGDTLYIDQLKVKTQGRLALVSLEDVIISSGQNKNNKGFINAIHINPDLDQAGNPIRYQPYIPFAKQRFRAKPKRPIHKNQQCRRGCACQKT